MELNEKDIVQLRKIVEERLERLPIIGKRIKIDKDILEILLFNKVYVINDEGKTEDKGCKYVAWSGPFLSKVDLSDISFDNVLWGYFGEYDERFYICGLKEEIYVDLSHTNAKINFNKSARKIYDGCNAIINCNFEKVDLSKASLDSNTVILNSNLRKTGIHFESISTCEYSDLSGNDLSNITCTPYSFISGEDGFGPFTNLKNTGLNITSLPYDENVSEDSLKISMSLGNLDGCYIDGELIDIPFRKRKENRTFIDEIDKQIKELKFKHRK